jgi:hypothetical protein
MKKKSPKRKRAEARPRTRPAVRSVKQPRSSGARRKKTAVRRPAVPFVPKRVGRPSLPARIVPALVVLGCAAFLGCHLLFTVPSSTPAVFKGYVTVYYRGPRPLAEVVAFIRQQADIEAVVSRDTAEVLYTDFSGFATVPLSLVDRRFDALDPRLDDYMKNVSRYFSVRDGGTDWNVFYVATRRNPLYLSLILERIAGTSPADWYVCEAGRNESTILVALLGTAFFVCLLLLSSRTAYRLILTAGIFPWLLALARGGIAEFMLFFFVAAYWAFFLREYLAFSENELLYGWRDADKVPLLLRLGLYAGMILIVLVFVSLVKEDLADITLALFGQAVLLAGHWGALRLLKFIKDQKGIVLFRGFRPLTILRRLSPRKPVSLRKGYAVHGLVVLLCLIPLALLIQPSAGGLSRPRLQPVSPEAGISLPALRRLSENQPASALPDLSDFVRHAAFQERLAYQEKPAYALPAAGERIVVSQYRLVGHPGAADAKIERDEQTMRSFDDAWLRTLEDEAGPSSVERMLFAQGRCLAVSFARQGASAVFAEKNWTIVIIFSIVLIPILLLHYTKLPSLVYGREKSAGQSVRKKR